MESQSGDWYVLTMTVKGLGLEKCKQVLIKVLPLEGISSAIRAQALESPKSMH